MTAPRRLAAILAVHVVGYSRLMGEDEAATAGRCAKRLFVRRLRARPPRTITRAIDRIGVIPYKLRVY
jgi:hypothetical protein